MLMKHHYTPVSPVEVAVFREDQIIVENSDGCHSLMIKDNTQRLRIHMSTHNLLRIFGVLATHLEMIRHAKAASSTHSPAAP